MILNSRRNRSAEAAGGAPASERPSRLLAAAEAGPRPFARAAAGSLLGSSLLVIAISLAIRPPGRLPRSQEAMITAALVGVCFVVGAFLASAWWPPERRPSLDRLAAPETRAAIWLSLAIWFPLLVVEAYLKARATQPPGIEWGGFGFRDKRWVSTMYLLGTIVPMLLLTASARLLTVARERPVSKRVWLAKSFAFGRDDAVAPADVSARNVGRVALKVLSAIALAYYFFGPPWYVAHYPGGIDYHEDVHFGGIQAIASGGVPYIGSAAVQYGPGMQLATYLYMKHVGGMSVVGFRESFALYHWLGASIIFLALFLRLRYRLAFVTALAAVLIYPTLQLFGFPPGGGAYAGFWGWGDVLRYAGAFALLMLFQPVVRRSPARRGVAAGVALGVLWGLSSYFAQENLVAGALGLAAISALLLFSNSAGGRAVLVTLGSIAAGFAGVWLPVLGYYAAHGVLGRFMWLYFFIPRAVASGYSNSSYLEGLHSPWGRMYYVFPFVLALVSLLSVLRFRPLRIAERWSQQRVLLVSTVAATTVLYEGALLRADQTHLFNTMLPVPALLAVTATALPRTLGARRPVTLAAAGVLAVAVALVLVPREQLRGAYLWQRLEAPYVGRHNAAQQPVASPGNSLAARRIGAGLVSAPSCCSGSTVSMAGFIRLMNQIHRLVGDRITYVASFRDAYPGLIYFVADLRPAPIPLEPNTMVLTKPQRDAYMLDFQRRTVKSVRALLTDDLGSPESDIFIAAYPTYRKIVLRYKNEPYYLLLR